MSIDHRIVEIEEQRNFAFTRCARMADTIGELEATLDRLTKQLAEAMKPPSTTIVIDDDPEYGGSD